jgi:RNA polymerase sigma-70 factor (ECF subfamily)
MTENDLPNNPNTEAFVGLLTANQRKLFAYIMSLVVNVNDADDILQETVKMMWSKFDQFELGTDFLSWAATMAHYRVLEFRKRKQRREVVFDDDVFTRLQSQAMTELQNTDDYLVHLRQCLKKLKAGDLGLIKMRYVNGLPVKEIASRVGRNLQSVYRSIARIQDLLRHCIKRQLASEKRT